MSTVGDKLGRYELITRIGQGGMAEVQLAIQRGPAGFEKLVVVKLVHENLASQKTFVDMLLDEARVAALVKHPNVVDIYDLGEDGGRYFIAMEYLEGEPLLAVLRAGRDGKRLDVMSTARLIADTAEGLEAAHELRSMSGEHIELVHHDISLGNIVVLYDGQVKLVDFGVAKATQSAKNTEGHGKVQGKFSYMAPEKLRGASGDRRSDIFSLGCVLWEALTLRRLFKGGNDADTMKQVLESVVPRPSEVNGDVPTEFDAIVLKALERDPENRYGSAAAMAEDLEEVLRAMNYARKNAVIARYMQETFKDHIVARKKLLQEVSSKGRASAAILEAAFDEPLAAGSPVDTSTGAARATTGDAFSIKFKRPTLEHAVVMMPPDDPPVAEFSTQEKIKTGAEPLDAARWKDPGSPSPERVRAPTESPSAERVKSPTDSPLLVPRPRTVLPPAPTPKRSPMVLLIVGAIAIVGILIAAFAMSSRGNSEPTPPPPHRPVSVPPLPPVDAATPDASEVPLDAAAAVTPLDAGVAAGAPLDAGHRAPPPALDLDATFKLGLQALVRGDAKTALAHFKKVEAANASYAPAWRGLGLAYEKTGETAQARAAYQHYLQLAPNASDAAAIKKRLEALAP